MNYEILESVMVSNDGLTQDIWSSSNVFCIQNGSDTKVRMPGISAVVSKDGTLKIIEFFIINGLLMKKDKNELLYLSPSNIGCSFSNSRNLLLGKKTMKVILQKGTYKEQLLVTEPIRWREVLSSKAVYYDFNNNYEFNEMIGSGGYARVFKVERKIDKKVFAGKIFEKKKTLCNEGFLEMIQNEISIHRQLKHPNISKYLETCETLDLIIIVSEYIKGRTLSSMISSSEVPRYLRPVIMSQLYKALDYLQKQSIIHRDISPNNILVEMGPELQIKLIDFGLSFILGSTPEFKIGGSPGFIAPEMLRSSPKNTIGYEFSVDVFSAGMVHLKMALGTSTSNILRVHSKKDMLKQAEDVYPHEWLDGEESLVKSCIVSDPFLRPRVRDIFQHPFFLDELSEVKEVYKFYLCTKEHICSKKKYVNRRSSQLPTNTITNTHKTARID